MKLALLILIYSNSITSQILPADQCAAVIHQIDIENGAGLPPGVQLAPHITPVARCYPLDPKPGAKL